MSLTLNGSSALAAVEVNKADRITNKFIALVSISLGVINLLPIPMLDGGHLMYYFAEVVRGKPLSQRIMEIGTRFGVSIVIVSMVLALYNDINRLLAG